MANKQSLIVGRVTYGKVTSGAIVLGEEAPAPR